MEIIKDIDGGRFYVEIDGVQADLKFRMNDSVMDIYSTFTPPELRGQGLAGKITKAAFEYAKAEGFKVIPTCSYVEAFMQRHGEWESLRA